MESMSESFLTFNIVVGIFTTITVVLFLITEIRKQNSSKDKEKIDRIRLKYRHQIERFHMDELKLDGHRILEDNNSNVIYMDFQTKQRTGKNVS